MDATSQTPGDETPVRAAARALIEQQMKERLAIIDRLANSQEAEDALIAKLAELEQQRQRDWAEAQRLGWSPRDLKRLKLRAPSERARRPSRRGKSSGKAGPAEAPETEPAVAHSSTASVA